MMTNEPQMNHCIMMGESVTLPPEFEGAHIKLIFAMEQNMEVAKIVRDILKQSYIQRKSVS